MRLGMMAAALGAAGLLAGCGLPEGVTPTDKTAMTKACADGPCGKAMAMSADGRWVAVAGRDLIEVVSADDPAGPAAEITIGADALASSPDGVYLLIQHGVESASGTGIRILTFENGQAVWRTAGTVVGLLTNPRHSPFRQDGGAVEVSPYNDYSEVKVLNWRSKTETSFIAPSNAPGEVSITPLAVSEKVYPVAAWLTGDGKPRLIFGYGGASRLVQGEAAWAKPPSWRAFSRDAALFGGEFEGKVAIWDAKTGRIVGRKQDQGPCALAGGAPRLGHLMVVCADRDKAATRLTAWLFPGDRKVGEVKAGDGWTVRDWRVTDTGARLAVIETKAADGGASQARVRVVPLDAAGAPKVIELGKVAKPDDILISMSGSGRKLAVRMPDGRLLVYAPDSLGKAS